jgi:hypothetical protein
VLNVDDNALLGPYRTTRGVCRRQALLRSVVQNQTGTPPTRR